MWNYAVQLTFLLMDVSEHLGNAFINGVLARIFEGNIV